ncbi:MAG: hypothetical protein DRP74_00440 [Candidatus Omnitrophota bacterium]|nr:MAG: hypothetical protein DRP74_00440 [Candidatus Omnitrophota bacterium]
MNHIREEIKLLREAVECAGKNWEEFITFVKEKGATKGMYALCSNDTGWDVIDEVAQRHRYDDTWVERVVWRALQRIESGLDTKEFD